MKTILPLTQNSLKDNFEVTQKWAVLVYRRKFSPFNFLSLNSMGVHCSIYKVSYNVSNISYLNSPFPLLSFIPTLLIPRINWYHFCIYINVYTLFALYSSSYPFPHYLPSIPSPSPQTEAVLASCSLIWYPLVAIFISN
jgi:hypothetical protein